VRSEKKRKMENVAEFGFHDYTFDPFSVDHIYQEECEEETKENSKGNKYNTELLFRFLTRSMFSALRTAGIPRRRSQRRSDRIEPI
jgi:hypothetical protein